MDETLGEGRAIKFRTLIDQLRATVENIGKLTSDVEAVDPPQLAERAKIEYARRRLREAIFPMAIFGEPGWDLILDIYISEHGGKKISVKSACIASAVPNSTAIRWINFLIELELIFREKSVRDARVIYLNLTNKGRLLIEQYLKTR